ncbi:MAG: PhzF family phenazine biosynthesis protein [Heliobacteriaceae bacterium]|jgi:PhzF family phenazine biosynthesis protein|nr:PhzF family phenazine biosynthesis protein [Heliobacteriaceae bacterium]
MNIEVFVVNSFAKNQDGGNPAGVVLGLDCSEQCMLDIAREAGFSETAFLNKIDEKHYEIRYFTPSAEVDLCGHATIAAFYLLKNKNMIIDGSYKLNTKAGEIDIKIQKDNVFMTQNLPEYSEIVSQNEILRALNLKKEDLIEDLPAQVVSTGLRDIIIPVKHLETLLNMKPNFDVISELSKKYNTIGVHAFTPETMFYAAAHCRNFAPLYEIPEESATGTASGALSCYLFKYGQINRQTAKKLIFEQGYSMNKPSEILASLDFDNEQITSVNVGGTALLAQSEIIRL